MSTVDEGALGRGESGRGERPGRAARVHGQLRGPVWGKRRDSRWNRRCGRPLWGGGAVLERSYPSRPSGFSEGDAEHCAGCFAKMQIAGLLSS